MIIMDYWCIICRGLSVLCKIVLTCLWISFDHMFHVILIILIIKNIVTSMKQPSVRMRGGCLGTRSINSFSVTSVRKIIKRRFS